MNKPFTPATGNGLRQRMIEDMTVRGFSAKTQHDYLRIVERFAAFLGARRISPRQRIFAGFKSSSARPECPLRP